MTDKLFKNLMKDEAGNKDSVSVTTNLGDEAPINLEMASKLDSHDDTDVVFEEEDFDIRGDLEGLIEDVINIQKKLKGLKTVPGNVQLLTSAAQSLAHAKTFFNKALFFIETEIKAYGPVEDTELEPAVES